MVSAAAAVSNGYSMALGQPPTTDLGYLSDSYGTTVAYVDAFELISDLQWPLSVRTYHMMRGDPQLTAVLNAYTLPLRQAPRWVDPAGCRDEVVQLVADDLGIPILGADDVPGPARRRGVDMSQHIRLALNCLSYGHYPFEERYDLINGQVRLAALNERTPQTIRDIRIDDHGYLVGIQQNASDALIPVNRMVWHSHQREGALWQGRSMLRPAYGAWLLKHEAWRTLATSGRRFGMGVPTVEAPPGATPGQISQARDLATSVRVGDQSGAGLPAGFTFKLTGLQGSTPDMLGFIRYLDSQMAQMALAGLMNLDSSPNGSRALGDTWLNLMLLSLNSIAEDLAAEITRLVIRMVTYNWGEDEPAPRIVIGDVASRPEATAAAIRDLVRFGAITPDQALESWIRDRWKMPQRDDGPVNLRPGPPPQGPFPEGNGQEFTKPGAIPSQDPGGPNDPGQNGV